MNILRLSLLLVGILGLASPAQLAAQGEDISQQWAQTYQGSSVFQFLSPTTSNVMAMDDVGNVIVAGNALSLDNPNDSDSYTVKYAAADGAVLWEVRQHGGTFPDQQNAVAVAVDGDGNVIVLGGDLTGDFYHTAKYRAADGALLWEQYYYLSETVKYQFAVQPAALAVDVRGNVLVTGTTYDPDLPVPASDCFTLKYAAADGAVVWSRHSHGPGNADYPKAIGVDYQGNVFVTAESVSRDTSAGLAETTYFYTVKYRAADGAVQWEKVRETEVNSFDYPAAMVVDAPGNVIVTGGTKIGYTAKYEADHGNVLWEKIDAGFRPSALVLGYLGYPTITGDRDAGVQQTAYYTVQYNRDGLFQWERYFNGAAGTQNVASAVAVDLDGNIYVTGRSQNNSAAGQTGSYTAKYSVYSGSPLWEMRYDSPAGLSYDPHHLVVTPDGGVAITGRSYLDPNAFDVPSEYRTIKYAPPDTATLPFRLTSPYIYGTFNATIPVDYTLREVAAEGTLKLTFDGPVTAEIVLGTAQGTADRHRFDLHAADLTASPEVASVNGAGALVAGNYTATLSYQDALGHPAVSVSAEFVTIITPTLPPVLTAPADYSTQRFTIGVAFTLPTAALPGSVSLHFNNQTLVLASSQESAGEHAFSIDPKNPTASPEVASGGPIPDGTYTVALRYRDAAINPAASTEATEVLILTGPAYSTFVTSGDAVPRGTDDPRIVEGSVWTHFGVPVINEDGIVTYRGEWRTPGGRSKVGIFFAGRFYTAMVAEKDDAAVGGAGGPRPGLTYKRFDEPVESGYGVAFRATLQGDGVSPGNDTALYAGEAGLYRIVREGQEMPGAPGSQLAAITSVAVRGDRLLMTGKLRRGPGGITADNDTGAWRWQLVDHVFAQVVRTGTVLAGVSPSPVKSFRLLQTASGLAGTGRGFWRGDVATFEATFADGTSALIDADSDGTTVLYASGDATVPGLPGAKWATFGPPATPELADGIAFHATLQTGPGGATKKNAKRLFFQAGSIVSVARGDAAPGLPSGATFSAFKDPVISPGAAAFAFAGTAQSGGTPIPGIWWLRDGGPLQDVVAAVGAVPPGLAPGARWSQFTSLAATDFGPIFTARLAGTPASQDVGLWATDSTGILRQLIRKGDSLHDKTVATFTVLTAPPGTPGVRRSFTGDGRVIVRVAFTDGSVELVIVTVP